MGEGGGGGGRRREEFFDSVLKVKIVAHDLVLQNAGLVF